MTDEYPRFLYKYRSIPNDWLPENALDLKNIPLSLDALFNSYAVFSSRVKFNDIFDSKIDFIRPSTRQLKTVRNNASKKNAKFIDKLFRNGEITAEGNNFLEDLKIDLINKIDSYLFFCTSACSTSNLMWSHYASNHQGFCIEFRTEKLTADKVKYQKNIPQIALSEVLDVYNKSLDNVSIGQTICEALRTKLEEWRYEEEYRFQLSDAKSNNPIKIDKFSSKMKYDAEFIESIIFGCRTPEPIKQFIVGNMPYPVKFKQAIETKNTVEIIDSQIISTQYRTSTTNLRN